MYLDTAVCNTAESLRCSSRLRSQRDTQRHLPPRKHTLCASTPSLRRSYGSTVTRATKGKGHLWATQPINAKQSLNNPLHIETSIFCEQTQAGRSVTLLCFSCWSSAVRPVVPWWRVDAGVGPDLHAPTAAHGAVGPHRPRRPATVHWK